jgi:D-alanyl-D-alanine carboxypeptidase (penicillin-binding protein 5/6)
VVKVEGLRRFARIIGIVTLAWMLGLGWAPPTAASAHVRRHHRRHASGRRRGPLYHAVLLEDADTGRVLYEQNAELVWPPASMAKMMLLLVAADQIRAGRFSLSSPVAISAHAAYTHGSHLGLRAGDVYPLGELMKAALIRSANDAAVAVAEKIGGSVEGTVRMMNQRAQTLGMYSTHYETVDGLPPEPGHDVDYTTALDLATLARAVIHNTNLLEWSSMETAPFDNGVTLLRNTNHLVGHLEGCDGLKTGFTMKAGFNLTATARRGDMRFVSVVLGAPSNAQRFAQTARVLNWGFENFEKVQLLKRGQPLPVHVQVESGPLIQPVSQRDIAVVVPKSALSGVKFQYNVPSLVNGPVTFGESLGQVTVLDGDEVMTRVDAVCPIAFGAPSRITVEPASADGVTAPASGVEPMSASTPATSVLTTVPAVNAPAANTPGLTIPASSGQTEETR